MATFEAQIEALTQISIDSDSIPNTTQVDQFLNDGVLDYTAKYLKAFPAEGPIFGRESSEYTSNSADLNSALLISVIRESGTDNDWRVCRKSFPGMESMLQDKDSIHYASAVNPAYVQLGDSISVYPTPDSNQNAFKVYYINNSPLDGDSNALTIADSTIAHFPLNKVYMIVAYAAMKVVEAKVADYTVNEEDPELMQSYLGSLQVLRTQYYGEFGSQQQPQGGASEG